MKSQFRRSLLLLLLVLFVQFPSSVCFVHSIIPLHTRLRTTALGATGFYVHIPYCRRRCRYCDFAIVPIGTASKNNTRGFQEMDATYRRALLQEIEGLEQDAGRPLSSIYFGGGTPSLAPIGTIRAILTQIRSSFVVDDDVEITMEMDPGTFDEDHLRALKESGVNRISLGVQSLNDVILEQIGRVHRVKDIYNAIDMIRRVGITNYSIDLMTGLPGLSLAQWADTLQTALCDLNPTHLSIYDLQIEEGTVFGKWYDNDEEDQDVVPTTSKAVRQQLPSPEDCAYMYKYTSGYLRHKGFEHYEISSYALPDHRSRHNQVYWRYDAEWYAVGLGATSFLQNHRYARPRAMADYIKWVERHEPINLPPQVDENDRLTDVLLTRLRTSDGLDLGWLKKEYGDDVVQSVLKGADLGLDLGLAQHEEGTLRLVDPQGFLFSNTILSSIFLELDERSE